MLDTGFSSELPVSRLGGKIFFFKDQACRPYSITFNFVQYIILIKAKEETGLINSYERPSIWLNANVYILQHLTLIIFQFGLGQLAKNNQ